MTILKLPHLSQDKYDAIRDLILEKAPQAVTFMVYSPTLQIGVFYFMGVLEYIPESLSNRELGFRLHGIVEPKARHEFLIGFAELTKDYLKKEEPLIVEPPTPIEIAPPPDPISPNPSPPIDLSPNSIKLNVGHCGKPKKLLAALPKLLIKKLRPLSPSRTSSRIPKTPRNNLFFIY